MSADSLLALSHRACPSQSDGACSIDFIGKGEELHFISCGADAAVSIRQGSGVHEKPQTVFTKEPVAMLCMRASPTGKVYAVGDAQGFVKVIARVTVDAQSGSW